LNIGDLSKGVYFLRLMNGEASVTKRIIVTK